MSLLVAMKLAPHVEEREAAHRRSPLAVHDSFSGGKDESVRALLRHWAAGGRRVQRADNRSGTRLTRSYGPIPDGGRYAS